MDFIGSAPKQIDKMLQKIGLSSVEELFSSIPDGLLCDPVKEDDGLCEFEGLKKMQVLSEKNMIQGMSSFLGGGAYDHHVPAIVSSICQKGGFLTSYTPYQAEASQGTLQVAFEYQTAICALTGMEVANAGVYDAASACAEAVLMALRVQKKRRTVLLASSLHPHYKQVVTHYLQGLSMHVIDVPLDLNGTVLMDSLEELCTEDVAALVVQSPNFFGLLEDCEQAFSIAKECGALAISVGNPLSYGLFNSPKEQGADIACGDTQVFGIPLQFGGPYAGFMSCNKKLIRQMPGRIVGKTVDASGKEGYTLTLQAREQHIRREKATSNICTSQSLATLASLISLLWYGKEGVKKLALTNYQRAHYLHKRLVKECGFTPFSSKEFFNEFALSPPKGVEKTLSVLKEKKIVGGLHLGQFFSEHEDHLLIAVTEKKSKQELDAFVEVVKGL